MPETKIITIVQKPGGEIEPENGIRETVGVGDHVQFVPGGDLLSVTVDFKGDSPFNQLDAHAVNNEKSGRKGVVKAIPASANRLFRYDCKVKTKDGGNREWPSGGEIEIIRGFVES